MVRLRSVALVTRDPSLYHELAGFLRERRLPSVSLLPGERIPDRVAVVLTSAAERELISHPNVLTVQEGGDRAALGAAVEQAMGVATPGDPIVVGIDPGPRPGYAILSGSTLLGRGVLEAPEGAGTLAAHLKGRFRGREIVYRVGSGDPPSRNRVVNALLARGRTVELVREHGTTPRGHRRPRDAVAAERIGRGVGTPVRQRMIAAVTAGEIANLQRLSREGSDGRITIPRSSAFRVLRGELTMAEAVAAMDPAGRRAGGGSRPTAPHEPL